MIKYIRDIAQKENIEFVGICDFDWVSSELLKCRAVGRLPKNSKSIILFLFPYYIDVKMGNVSRYAVVPDYHDVCYKKLSYFSDKFKERFQNFNFSPFVDDSPIPEVKAASKAGLGVVGDNGLLINKKYGSWVFIGEIVTDMLIEDDIHSTLSTECIHCGKCVERCPSKAIGGQTFNKNVCLSYITQKKGALSSQEIDLLRKGNLVWGCDTCQECCPLNSGDIETPLSEFHKNIQTVVNDTNYYKFNDRAYFWRPKNVIDRNNLLIN